MVFFNYATMEMSAKIVYYGPGLCGKTTNLQYIYKVTNPQTRGEMVSLATETDRTLYFDLLPIHLGTIGGFKTRFQLYTVPGQVFYNSTRKLVLKGVDAVVFVADSQEPMLDANMEALENLQDNLDLNLTLDDIPWVIQYNKRDLPNILSLQDLNEFLNPGSVPNFEACAVSGKGVLETLKGISKLTLLSLKKKTGQLGEQEEKEMKAAPAASAVKFATDEDDEREETGTRPRPQPQVAQEVVSGRQTPGYVSKTGVHEMAPAPQADQVSDVVSESSSLASPLIKEVTQKLVVPISLKKNEIGKNVQVRLKLDIDFQFTKE